VNRTGKRPPGFSGDRAARDTMFWKGGGGMRLTGGDPIQMLPGVGPKKAGLYRKLQITTVRSLLLHLPRTYLDLRIPAPLDEVMPNDGVPHLIHARIVAKSAEQRIRKNFSIFHVRAQADGTDLLLTFYNMRYAVAALKVEEEAYFYGPVGGTLLRREMKAPEIIAADRVGSFLPVYPSTTGLSPRVIAKDVQTALSLLDGPLTDAVSDRAAAQQDLCPLMQALALVHRPDTLADADRGRRRILFSSLYTYSAAMLTLRGERSRETAEPFSCVDPAALFASLPYAPTGAQRRAVADICADLASGRVMNRLIQGDVGSGKTLIAAAAIWCAVESGLQAALMAPTEILAEQHFGTFERLFAPFSIRIGLLTGAMSAAKRRETLAALQNGELDFLIGTHTLFQKDVSFARLGLVVTDEQHRFGVAQRAALSGKSSRVHTLVMSATPIPRTLTLILYGDLDVSVVDEMPAGRTPVATYCIGSDKRARALAYVRKHLDAGLQAYIVCPLVEEGEETPAGLHDAVRYAQELAEGELAGYRVGVLHGKLKPAEKDDAMRRFAAGEIQALVATTVIEVGVDVPNAAILLVENAERFGLSQLHQLRGRVGRGSAPSTCILISDAAGETARERLKILRTTTDGFAIAREDLRLRGPGELLGLRQHGLPSLDLVSDPALLEAAQQAAVSALHRDPLLERPENAALREEVERLLGSVGKTVN